MTNENHEDMNVDEHNLLINTKLNDIIITILVGGRPNVKRFREDNKTTNQLTRFTWKVSLNSLKLIFKSIHYLRLPLLLGMGISQIYFRYYSTYNRSLNQ